MSPDAADISSSVRAGAVALAELLDTLSHSGHNISVEVSVIFTLF